MKKWLCFLFTVVLISSCSKVTDDILGEDGGDNPDNEIPKLSLYAFQNQKNIFEMIQFHILTDGKTYTLLDLCENYDSIVWKVSGKEESYKIFEIGNSNTEFKMGWGHNFFFSGRYDSFLSGYKEGEVIYKSDTISVYISDDKDFLGYDWKDIKGSIGHSLGYTDVFSNDYFKTYQDVHDGIPSVRLSLWFDGYRDEQAFIRKSEKVLLDYISSLYASPTYDLSKEEILLEKYNDLFAYKKDNAYPEYIWLTPKSKIVLLKCYDKVYTTYFTYEIYAEPCD